MNSALRKRVYERAQFRCEYCHLRQRHAILSHEIDHVRARKHRGSDELENLCLACTFCNGFKGTNPAGYDPDSDEMVPLFNPRTDEWDEHFFWGGIELIGRTAIGRATIEVLRINDEQNLDHRRLLSDLGEFEPE